MERKEVEALIVELEHSMFLSNDDMARLLVESEDIIGAIDEEGLEDTSTADFANSLNDTAYKLNQELDKQKALIKELLDYLKSRFKISNGKGMDFYIRLNIYPHLLKQNKE